MKNQKNNFVVALGAVSVILLAACESTTGSGSDSEARVKADLKVMASKVTYMSASNGLPDKDEEAAAGLAKRAVDCYNGSVDGVTISEDTGTDELGGAYISKDTVRHYTAANTLACEEEDKIAYETSNSYDKDALTEVWMKTRTDYGSMGSAEFIKMTGSGKVHYFSGYDIGITAMNITIGANFTMSAYKMDLSLGDGRYTVALGIAPGVDLMSETEPSATTVVMTGPIKQGAAIVGYFEIMGDDRVVIRDAAKIIVAAH